MPTLQPIMAGGFVPGGGAPTFIAVFGRVVSATSILTFDQNIPVPASGKLLNLRVRVATPPGLDKNLRFTIVVDGVATALNCTIRDLETEASCVNVEVGITEGQKFHLRVDPHAAPTVSSTWVSLSFAGLTDRESILLAHGRHGFGAMSRFIAIAGGSLHWDIKEDYMEVLCPTNCSLSKLRVGINQILPAGSSLRFVVRRNGADTALECTIPAGSQEASNLISAVSVIAGDRISLRFVGVGTIPFDLWRFSSLRVTAETDGWSIAGIGAIGYGLVDVAGCINRFDLPISLGARLVAMPTTEDDLLMSPQEYRLERFFASARAGVHRPATTVTFAVRANFADTPISLAIPSGTSGSDLTNSFFLRPFERISMRFHLAITSAQVGSWGLGGFAIYTPPPPSILTGKAYALSREEL